MKTFQLEGKPRKEIGKKAVKALRGEGLIPAVLYGHRSVELPYSGKLEDGQVLVENQGKGVVVTNFTVTTDAVRKLIYSPEVFIVELNIGGHKQTAMLKDLQLHPVTDEILHIDFLAVFPDMVVSRPSLCAFPRKTAYQCRKSGAWQSHSDKTSELRQPDSAQCSRQCGLRSSRYSWSDDTVNCHYLRRRGEEIKVLGFFS